MIAGADAGLEHREVAFALLKVQAGERKQRFEGAELFTETFREHRQERLRTARLQAGERVIADLDAIDLDPFVETIKVRGGEQAGPQAIGAADTGAHGCRAALAVEPVTTIEMRCSRARSMSSAFKQFGHTREAKTVTVFRKIEHYSSPMAEKV